MKFLIAFVFCLSASHILAFDQSLYDNFEKVGGNPISLDQLNCFLENNQDKTFRSGLKIKKERYVTIHDLTKKGNEYRFFIIDLETQIVRAYPSAHGSGRGKVKNNKIKALFFSNKLGTDLTPTGFFITGPVYKNWKKKWRYGIKLFGLQEGENENAYDRGIVIHAAKNRKGSYVENDMISSEDKILEIEKLSMLSGMSDGCSAVPPLYWESIRDMIKEGTLFFVFNDDYLNKGSSYCVKL